MLEEEGRGRPEGEGKSHLVIPIGSRVDPQKLFFSRPFLRPNFSKTFCKLFFADHSRRPKTGKLFCCARFTRKCHTVQYVHTLYHGTVSGTTKCDSSVFSRRVNLFGNNDNKRKLRGSSHAGRQRKATRSRPDEITSAMYKNALLSGAMEWAEWCEWTTAGQSKVHSITE